MFALPFESEFSVKTVYGNRPAFFLSCLIRLNFIVIMHEEFTSYSKFQVCLISAWREDCNNLDVHVHKHIVMKHLGRTVLLQF